MVETLVFFKVRESLIEPTFERALTTVDTLPISSEYRRWVLTIRTCLKDWNYPINSGK